MINKLKKYKGSNDKPISVEDGFINSNTTTTTSTDPYSINENENEKPTSKSISSNNSSANTTATTITTTGNEKTHEKIHHLFKPMKKLKLKPIIKMHKHRNKKNSNSNSKKNSISDKKMTEFDKLKLTTEEESPDSHSDNTSESNSNSDKDNKERASIKSKEPDFSLSNNKIEVEMDEESYSESDGKDGEDESSEEGENKRTLEQHVGKGAQLTAPSGTIVEPQNWGFPGYLTEEEEKVYHEFVNEVNNHINKDEEEEGSNNNNNTNEWTDTIFSFGYNEEKEYGYCRWLRARNFNLKDVLTMVEKATELRNEPKKDNFYPNASLALGIEEAIYKTQIPQIFTGHAKNSCPIFVSKPGMINMTGLNCITTGENMHKYQWHTMIYKGGAEYKLRQEADPTFKRFQSFAIFDLDGLGITTLTGAVMDLMKHQSFVDSMCFPETMNKLIVTNAPGFFTATWNIMRRWIDVRTANKIEIYSSKAKYEKRLKELVDIEQLPVDYGGNGPSVAASILTKCNDATVTRRVAKVMSFKVHDSTVIVLEEGEWMDVIVYTRSKANAEFSIANADDKSQIIAKVELEQPPDEDEVSITNIVSNFKGPGRFKIYGDIGNTGFYSSTENYLVVGNIKIST